MTFFREMGFIAYPLTIVAVFLVVEILRAARVVWNADGQSATTASARIHPVLVWGVLAAVLGILGTVVGVALAASFLSRVEPTTPANPALIWSGIRVTLGSTIVGMLLLGVASISWLVLQFANGRRVAAPT